MNAPVQLDRRQLEKVAKRIATHATREWTLMEICSGQTASFLELELEELLPKNIHLMHGPSCAICTASLSYIDRAIAIAQLDSVIFCAPGDLLRLKGSQCDLLEIKAQGHDVRVVHSPLDCLNIARAQPDKNVVFFSIGFEMTAQANALSIWQAKRLGVKNYSLLGSHGYVPSICSRVLSEPNSRIQGIIGLGNVCTVSGFAEYENISRRFSVPVVVTGYEAINLLEGIDICIQMLESGKNAVENQFRETVSKAGNKEAKALINEVFELADREWRGIGRIENGGYKLRPDFEAYDAELIYPVDIETKADSDACISKDILLGFKKPTDCPLFGKSCRPGTALGATMVSNEGTCATYFNYAHHSHAG